jgi:hypothetical protein
MYSGTAGVPEEYETQNCVAVMDIGTKLDDALFLCLCSQIIVACIDWFACLFICKTFTRLQL